MAFEALEAQAEMLFPGAAACVRRLAEAFPLGIASGALRHEIESVLDRSGLRPASRSSSRQATRRRASRPRIRTCERRSCMLARAEECLAIEDSRWGLESARTAGLACVGITHTYPRAELAAAHRIVDSLDELTPELCRALRPHDRDEHRLQLPGAHRAGRGGSPSRDAHARRRSRDPGPDHCADRVPDARSRSLSRGCSSGWARRRRYEWRRRHRARTPSAS